MQLRDVDDSNSLYRWIHPDHVKDDRVTSAAFKHKDKEKTRRLSVDIVEMTTAEECLSLSNVPGTRLAVLAVGQVRNFDTQDVVHDPLPSRYSHALVVGEKPPPICKMFARHCVLLPPASAT